MPPVSVLFKERGFVPFLFGLAFLHTWIHATVTAPVYGIQASNFFVFSVSSGTLLAALGLIIGFHRQIAHAMNGRFWLVAFTVLAIMGTLLMSDSLPFFRGSQVLVIVATALTALGTGGLLVLWGELYARLKSASVQVCATFIALIISFFLYLLVSSFPEVLALIMAAALPLLSALCSRRVLLLPKPALRVPLSVSTRQAGVPLSFLAFILAFSVPLDFINVQISSTGSILPKSAWTLIFACALLMMVAALFGEALLQRRKTTVLPFLMVLLATGSLLLFLFSDSGSTILTSILCYSSYFLFVAVFYSHLGITTKLSRWQPFLVFAVGNAVNVLGNLVGTFIGFLVGQFVSPWLHFATIAIVYLLFFVGLFLIPQSRQNIFLGADGIAQIEDKPVYTLARCVEENCRIVAKKGALSPREEEVLNLLVRGRSVQSIAEAIMLSQNTVKTHVFHIYQKLDVHTREDLILLIERTGNK